MTSAMEDEFPGSTLYYLLVVEGCECARTQNIGTYIKNLSRRYMFAFKILFANLIIIIIIIEQ